MDWGFFGFSGKKMSEPLEDLIFAAAVEAHEHLIPIRRQKNVEQVEVRPSTIEAFVALARLAQKLTIENEELRALSAQAIATLHLGFVEFKASEPPGSATLKRHGSPLGPLPQEPPRPFGAVLADRPSDGNSEAPPSCKPESPQLP